MQYFGMPYLVVVLNCLHYYYSDTVQTKLLFVFLQRKTLCKTATIQCPTISLQRCRVATGNADRYFTSNEKKAYCQIGKHFMTKSHPDLPGGSFFGGGVMEGLFFKRMVGKEQIQY